MGHAKTLVCAAMPFGYGPAAKLIALARVLRGDARLVFAGVGVALELVERAAGLFDEIVPHPATHPTARAHLQAADAVLSLMDRDAGTAAAQAKKPLFVVDSLLWMRDQVPEPLRRAEIYWAQAFPGLEPEIYDPRPAIVGPVLDDALPARGPRTGLVVHLGGSAAPDDRRALYGGYARCALRAVVEADLADRFGRVRVLAGGDALASLHGVVDDDRIAVGSAAPDEARAAMASAAAVLTSPGLTATLECFRAGTPTWFLPPQNYSQWLILATLRANGLGVDALHWEDLDGVPALERRMPASEHAPIVRAMLQRAGADAEVARRLCAGLAAVGKAPSDVAATQQQFLDMLGPPGTEAIAAALGHVLASPENPRCV